MAHPRREAFVKDLLDEIPDTPVVWDNKGDRWDTGARSLDAYEADATHHLVVQDDAILCKDFLIGCEEIIKHTGNSLVSLYIGDVRPHVRRVSPAVQHVLDDGGSWLRMPGPYWGVALIVPVVHIDALLEWGASRRHLVNYDKRIARWVHLEGMECLYTVPSLVDHRSEDENPSMVPGRKGDRRAQVFIGDRSPLEIDWSVPPTKLKTRFKSRNQKRERTVQVYVGGVNYGHMKAHPQYWEEVA